MANENNNRFPALERFKRMRAQGLTSVDMSATTPAPVTDTDTVAEKGEFSVIMTALSNNQKIKAIKVTREITGAGLAEAKHLVDNLPSKVLEGVSEDKAMKAKAELEAVGAKIVIKIR